MNLVHLRYAVEVEKTKSITKAAENLFMVQPNISRAIRELEEKLGISIFKRTSKGIVPTPEGEEFLDHAKEILALVDEMEQTYQPGEAKKQTFSISVPRASYIGAAFSRMISSIDLPEQMEFNYRETNAMRALDNIVQGNYPLAMVRYQSIHETHFLSLLKEKRLKLEESWEFRKVIVMSKNHPLAKKETILPGDLTEYLEIVHGDPYVPTLPITTARKTEWVSPSDRRILVYERGSQFELLEQVEGAYMWVSPVLPEILKRYTLVQRNCFEENRRYKDVLCRRSGYRLSSLDKQFIEQLHKIRQEITEFSACIR